MFGRFKQKQVMPQEGDWVEEDPAQAEALMANEEHVLSRNGTPLFSEVVTLLDGRMYRRPA